MESISPGSDYPELDRSGAACTWARRMWSSAASSLLKPVAPLLLIQIRRSMESISPGSDYPELDRSGAACTWARRMWSSAASSLLKPVAPLLLTQIRRSMESISPGSDYPELDRSGAACTWARRMWSSAASSLLKPVAPLLLTQIRRSMESISPGSDYPELDRSGAACTWARRMWSSAASSAPSSAFADPNSAKNGIDLRIVSRADTNTYTKSIIACQLRAQFHYDNPAKPRHAEFEAGGVAVLKRDHGFSNVRSIASSMTLNEE
jgi:hypothetical protein